MGLTKKQDLKKYLGLSLYIDGFNDNKPRKCYPFTLEFFDELSAYLNIFDNHNLIDNLDDATKYEAMYEFLMLSFKLDKNGMSELLEAIDSDNFETIIKNIKEVNGIKESEENENSGGSPIDWETSINAICTYTSIPRHKIKDLTFSEFISLMSFINKKINWNYKLNTISMVEKPDEYIKDEEYPLHCEPKDDFEPKDGSRRVVTMKEIMGFVNG